MFKISMPDLIEFNVGGQIFMSTYETIGYDKKSLLYAWYLERKGFAHLLLDKKGRFFIDRDPASFSIILNYLRLHSAKQLWEVCLPKDPDRLALLTQEAEFFRLPALRDQAVALLRKCTAAEEANQQQQMRGRTGCWRNGMNERKEEEEDDDEDEQRRE
uniref:Potassium channel tetramerisation-type BTB domain-containing protein n=1 Tax=Globodera rostochiensis TaxID=31243 RepID=A0A914HRB3_GLORO